MFGRKFAGILLVKKDPPLLALAIIACCTAHAQTYGISTFAGGAAPTNVPAKSSSASAPQAVAVDSAGNVFFADFYSDIVRVDAVTGLLSVVAGNGTPGFSGDNGRATNAQLNQPAGIALDPAGNLYIADTWNNRIRRVSNGVISTIAGDGTTGTLGRPYAVALDGAGNVYIADSFNNRLLEISLGTITTVATLPPMIGVLGVAVSPNGTLYMAGGLNVYQLDDGVFVSVVQNPPPLFLPTGIAVDASGNLYVAGSNEIFEISNGPPTVVAGNGTAGFSGDGGPAASAELNTAESVAVDAAGNLYIADFMNNRIRKVTKGVIATIAGNGTIAFSGGNGSPLGAQLNLPQGVAVDDNGNLYIADSASNRVFKVSHGVVTTIAGNGAAGFSGDNGPAANAQLNSPQGVAIDASGNVYITDTMNNRIRKVTSGVITTVVGNGTPGYSGDGGPALSAQLDDPQGGLAVDSAGNLYVADTFNGRIREVSNGVITTVAGNGRFGSSGDGGPAAGAMLNGPVGVAVDSRGNLYIADTGYPFDGIGRIRKVSNGIITTVAGAGLAPTPGNLGDNGAATAAALPFPKSVAVDAAGSIYIADAGGPNLETGGGYYARVRKVSNGVITTIGGNGTAGFSGDFGPGSAAALNVPQSVAVDASGNVYVADSGNRSLTSDGGNAFHLMDTGNNRIRLLSPNPAPTISTGGIVPNGGSAPVIQPGSWISIYGSYLANGTYLWNGDFPMSLGGTSVAIDGKQAYLWFVSPTQINAQAPDDAATGPVTVVVTTPFGTVSSTVTLAPYGPAFSLLGDGKHVAAEIISPNGTGAYDFGYYDLVGPANTFSFATRPVKPGEMLSLFGVGFGPTTPPVPAGVTFSGAAPTGSPVTITIGGVAARVIFEGLTAAGLYQFNVIVPNTPSGDQALQATVNGVQTALGPVVTIQ